MYTYTYTRIYEEHLDKNVYTVLAILTILGGAYTQFLIDI